MAKKQEIQEYANQLFNLHREIGGIYNAYAKNVGLTFPSLHVLAELWKVELCSQKDIIQKTYLPKQTVSAIIKNFNEQGLIEPLIESERDKRSKIIKLTAKGKEYANEVIGKLKFAVNNALEQLGEESRNGLLDTLRRYKENLKI